MRLYGNDMDETTTVVEADLSWIVGWKKAEFIGADVLRRQKADGVAASSSGSRCSIARSRVTATTCTSTGRRRAS